MLPLLLILLLSLAIDIAISHFHSFHYSWYFLSCYWLLPLIAIWLLLNRPHCHLRRYYADTWAFSSYFQLLLPPWYFSFAIFSFVSQPDAADFHIFRHWFSIIIIFTFHYFIFHYAFIYFHYYYFHYWYYYFDTLSIAAFISIFSAFIIFAIIMLFFFYTLLSFIFFFVFHFLISDDIFSHYWYCHFLYYYFHWLLLFRFLHFAIDFIIDIFADYFLSFSLAAPLFDFLSRWLFSFSFYIIDFHIDIFIDYFRIAFFQIHYYCTFQLFFSFAISFDIFFFHWYFTFRLAIIHIAFILIIIDYCH